MPIYEYQCLACDFHLEEFQKISDDPLTMCPSCQQAKLRKIISATHFQLKGTGWYETDFSGKQKPQIDQPSESTSAKESSQSTGESSSAAKMTEAVSAKETHTGSLHQDE